MNEEIKEILESSRKIIKSNRENGFDRIIMLGDDIDKILDCITNLQQENKRLKVNCNIGYEELKVARNYKSRLEKASNKLDSMFANGEENKILDDLLELDKIIKGDKQ